MKRSDPEADFLRLQQVAALLNISEREVARLRDRGELAVVYLGRTVLVARASYEALRDRLNAQAGLPPRSRLRKVAHG